MAQLLTRDDFRERVFLRDSHRCVVCGDSGVDAHHILERRLFSDGGYYLENGATVCERHHIECEQTIISVEQIREFAGITKPVLPEHMYSDVVNEGRLMEILIIISGMLLLGAILWCLG